MCSVLTSYFLCPYNLNIKKKWYSHIMLKSPQGYKSDFPSEVKIEEKVNSDPCPPYSRHKQETVTVPLGPNAGKHDQTRQKCFLLLIMQIYFQLSLLLCNIEIRSRWCRFWQNKNKNKKNIVLAKQVETFPVHLCGAFNCTACVRIQNMYFNLHHKHYDKQENSLSSCSGTASNTDLLKWFC